MAMEDLEKNDSGLERGVAWGVTMVKWAGDCLGVVIPCLQH